LANRKSETSGDSNEHPNPESNAKPSGFLGFLDLTDDQTDTVMDVDVDLIDLTVDTEWIDLTADRDMN
jgi:hypothetical protein